MASTLEAVEPVGTAGQVETPAGVVRYWECGEGIPLVFVHGLLANSLLVDPRHREASGGLDAECDACGRLYAHRVRIAKREDEGLPVFGNAIADARDFESAGEAVGYAYNHVADERARQAVKRAMQFIFDRAGNHDLRILDININLGAERLLQCTFGAFDQHMRAFELDRYAFR
jgi:hypothetical protein